MDLEQISTEDLEAVVAARKVAALTTTISEVEKLGSKSAKIKFLANAGWARADIAKHLGIRYQHVRNVLVSVKAEA